MGVKPSEEKLELMKNRNSVPEVSGWKVFIFLPQNTVWRFVMIFTVIGKFVYTVTRAAYGISPYFFEIVDGIFYALYFIDTVLATLHAVMGKVRRLRHGEKRHSLFILLDYVSLLPLKFIHKNTVYNMERKDEKIGYYFSLVGILRMYQVPKNFSDIKASVHEVRTYLIITVVQVFSYYVVLTHFLSCFVLLYSHEDSKKACFDNLFLCVFSNFANTFGLLSKYFHNQEDINYSEYYHFESVTLWIGYLFTNAYVIPIFLIVMMKYLVKHFELCRKQIQTKILIENLIKEKILGKTVFKYFYEMWSFESSEIEPDLMKVLPLCLKKNIFCDIYWEAIRHSHLLQDLSIGCKRSIALGMRTEILLPQTKLFEQEKNSTYFVYLQSGLLQLMAEENNRAPVLSLSAGTVIGEMSFFWNIKSKAFVTAAKYSVIHVLPMRYFFQVLADFPNDKKQVLYKVKARLKLAKSTYNIKTNICTYFSFDKENSKGKEETKWGNIKWIKGQYRGISNLQKAEKFYQYDTEDYEQWVLQLSTQMKHTSVNLSLLNVGYEEVYKEGVVCLKSFPWLMDPQSQFVLIWKKIVLFVAFITLLLYPAFIAWFPRIPNSFFVFSCIVTLIYITDIIVQCFTATKINNIIIQKFSTVFVHRFFSLYFYFDVAAAIPVQVFPYFVKTDRFGSNMYFANVLLKVYILIPAINHWNYSPKPMIFFRTYVKYMFFLLTLIYIFASIFYLTGVECIFYDCGPNDWFSFFKKNYLTSSSALRMKINITFYRAIMLCFITPALSGSKVLQSFLIFFFSYFFTRSFYFAIEGECIAAYVLDLTYELKYRHHMNFIFQYMGKNDLVGNVRERVMTTMQFQWKYDNSNYIPEKRLIWDKLPYYLRDVIDLEFVLPVLEKSRLFQWEDKPFLMDLCKRVSHLAVPEKSVLLTLGTQSKCLYVIQRGFVQINSFIAGDLYLNISKPIKAKAGDIFPVIDVLSQTPSAVTAITVSDCELLLLDLEDVISTMMIHGVFKDFVEAVRNTDLSMLTTAKLGVSEFKNVFSDKSHHVKIFDKIKYVGVVLRYLLGQRTIDSESKLYRFWELVRVLSIVASSILWPIAFGCCTNSSLQPNIIKGLFTADFLLFFVDFHIRIHVAYYNKIGIYVTHTLYTIAHHLTTAFITDFVAFSPNFHILHVIIFDSYDFQLPVIVVHVLLRSFSLYRFIGFLEYYRHTIRGARFIRWFFFTLLCAHYYLNFMVHLYIKGIEKEMILIIPGDIFVNFTRPHEYYFRGLAVILFTGLRSNIFFSSWLRLESHYILFILLVMGLFVLGQIWLYSHLILLSTTSNKSLTTFQHHLRNFVNFLTRQKAEDSIIKKAAEHFEHEWLQNYGYNMHKILSSLPQTLQEDILYPVYRETLSAVRCLAGANEYFYRTLSINVEEVFLKKDSVIIFHKEVQNNIFFVDKGQCFVKDLSQNLYKGSVIGDIRRQGFMKNEIIAKTNVKLLKIPSQIFFLTLDNFYATKMEFQLEVANGNDFIQSVYYGPTNDHHEPDSQEKEKLECEFVSDRNDESGWTYFEKKKKKWHMNPNTKKVQCLRFIFMIVAYATIIIIPVFVSVKLFSPLVLSIIYVLDFIWLAKIILSEYVIRPDYKEDPTSKKNKSKSLVRMRLFSIFMFRAVSVIPIELLPFAIYSFKMSDDVCHYMCYCYVNRFLRCFYIFHYFRKKGKRLLVNFFMNVLGLVMLKVAVYNFFCIIENTLTNKTFFAKKCYRALTKKQIEILRDGSVLMMNALLSHGFLIYAPNTALQYCVKVFILFFEEIVRAFMINSVLMILYITNHNKSSQMLRLQRLDKYLSARDVSPVLRIRAKKYFCNLLNAFYEGANPVFLYAAPPFIKTDIMADLYMSHLSNCFAFHSLEKAFLRQLTTRMVLNIFFPGDYITERGDVDHNMYFIQEGEVFCIETDSDYKALERVTGVNAFGDYFGVLQGIFPAYPHTHIRRAKTLTRILVLNFYKWEDLRLAFPEDFNSIYNRCLQSLA